MDSSAELIARIRKVRERWVDLDDARSVCVRRPGELALAQLSAGLSPELCCSYVVDWRGFTEADAFGDGDKAIKFDAGVWMALVEDRADWASKVTGEALSMITQHINGRGATSGNLPPS